MEKDTLRGQPFIGEYDAENHLRVCANCFYGTKEVHEGIVPTNTPCKTTSLANKLKLNGIPPVLDGKQVGYYCKEFNDLFHFEEY